MMAFGPDGSYTPIQADFEALQVARWALDCFVTSPIYRTRSYTRGQGNAKRAGTSRDGSSGIPVLLSVPYCLCLPYPLSIACSIMQLSYIFFVALLLLLEFFDKTAARNCE